METSFFWFGVFSGWFGVRSIVLCKCSGKYIDIYFILKITFYLIMQPGVSVLGGNTRHSSRVPGIRAPWVLSRPMVSGLLSRPSMAVEGLG